MYSRYVFLVCIPLFIVIFIRRCGFPVISWISPFRPFLIMIAIPPIPFAFMPIYPFVLFLIAADDINRNPHINLSSVRVCCVSCMRDMSPFISPSLIANSCLAVLFQPPSTVAAIPALFLYIVVRYLCLARRRISGLFCLPPSSFSFRNCIGAPLVVSSVVHLITLLARYVRLLLIFVFDSLVIHPCRPHII